MSSASRSKSFALLTGVATLALLAAAPAAHAKIHWNEVDPNGVSADSVMIVARGDKPDSKANTKPNPQPTVKRASSAGGVQVAGGSGDKPSTTTGNPR